MESEDQFIREQFTNSMKVVEDFPQKGVSFKDITPVLMNPILCSKILNQLAILVKDIEFDAIAGVETRGYLFGFALAQLLKVPFVIIRKAGKLPGKVIKKEYGLEYGKAAIEIEEDLLKPGMKVLIHDDLLATGGTAVAAAELIKEAKGEVAGFMFLIELSKLKGKEKLEKICNKIVNFTEF